MYNHQLDAFIITADLGSYGKAAEAVYISSPDGKPLYEAAKTIIKLSEDASSPIYGLK